MEIQITQRQLRVSELLRQKIADILLRGNIHDKNLSRYSITVSQVIVSPDLKSGKVFVSFLGEKNSDQILKDLNNYAFKIQKQVGNNLRLKRTPKLKFFIDDSFDNAAKINKSINFISDIDNLR